LALNFFLKSFSSFAVAPVLEFFGRFDFSLSLPFNPIAGNVLELQELGRPREV